MDRRAAGEELYRHKFDELGLSDVFTFLCRDWSSDHGRRVNMKCNHCGAEFSSWAFSDVLKGRQKHILCPHCGSASDGNDMAWRSPEAKAALVYYKSGHSVGDTAEQFGFTRNQINSLVKFHGVSNGRDFHAAGLETSIQNRKKRAERRIVDFLDSIGFEYLGGYTNKGGNVKIRCKECGHVFDRTADFVSRGNVICRKCEHEKALLNQAERKKQQKIASERRRKEKEAERIKANPFNLSDYQIKREKRLDEAHVCKECGQEYTIREYMRSIGTLYAINSGYCSAECRDKRAKQAMRESHKGRQDSHRKRARRFGCAYDPSVTLKKLVKRDGLKCAICGEACDWSDRSWSRYSGPFYPSIDHIVPMSKGGGHTWDNVQVAHIICNSEKGNKEVAHG